MRNPQRVLSPYWLPTVVTHVLKQSTRREVHVVEELLGQDEGRRSVQCAVSLCRFGIKSVLRRWKIEPWFSSEPFSPRARRGLASARPKQTTYNTTAT